MLVCPQVFCSDQIHRWRVDRVIKPCSASYYVVSVVHVSEIVKSDTVKSGQFVCLAGKVG